MLWVAIAMVAVLAVLAAVVWGLVASRASDQPVETTPAETDSSAADTQLQNDGWGPFPPPNRGELRDIGAPDIPATLGASFELEGTNEYVGSVFADYDDTAQPRVVLAILTDTHLMYRSVVEDMDEPTYIGNAVCGQMTDGAFTHTDCVMATANEVLHVGSASDTFTVEEMAALTQELYEAL